MASLQNSIFSALHTLPLSVISLFFLLSLIITIAASARFTYRLEAVSDIFDLSPSLLSLFGALGANIPNYVSSIIAIAAGQQTIGLGIIIGSNIYNIAIILCVSTFATPATHGLRLTDKAVQDIQPVARYTLAILATTQITLFLLSSSSTASTISSQATLVLIFFSILTGILFYLLCVHALHRVPHSVIEQIGDEIHLAPATQRTRTLLATILILAEVVLALATALAGVIVMVNTGQEIATRIHMPAVILGLIVLAIATSLPNTVVAFSLARTHRATACLEEVFSSNSINVALGLTLPLLFWHRPLHDPLLLWLDTPLMILLTALALLCTLKKRISRPVALLLLLIYIAWVGIHILV